MASIEFIQKRIAGKEKEIDKLEKKLIRIRKAEASGWTKNPYYYDESDMRHTLQDLDEAREALGKYIDDLEAAQEKAASRNVPAILEFLERWKRHCAGWYLERLTSYFEEKKHVHTLYKEFASLTLGSQEREEKEKEYDSARIALWSKLHGYHEKRRVLFRGRERTVDEKVREGEYECLSRYTREDSLEAAMKKVEKELSEEANRKYDFIIERTNAIVGRITDASGLTIGAKDELNGYIIGTDGRAKVQTIGAGGYNIQCFHFRTLIHKA